MTLLTNFSQFWFLESAFVRRRGCGGLGRASCNYRFLKLIPWRLRCSVEHGHGSGKQARPEGWEVEGASHGKGVV
jgi:hypothetical protein